MADYVKVQAKMEDEYGEDFLENYLAAPILDAKYEKTQLQTQLKGKLIWMQVKRETHGEYRKAFQVIWWNVGRLST